MTNSFTSILLNCPWTLSVDVLKFTLAVFTRSSRLSTISISSAHDAQLIPSTAKSISCDFPSKCFCSEVGKFGFLLAILPKTASSKINKFFLGNPAGSNSMITQPIEQTVRTRLISGRFFKIISKIYARS